MVRRGKYLVADIFSGAGGSSFGFHAHPEFQVVFAADRQVGKPCNGVGTLECNATYEAAIGIAPKEVDLGEYDPAEMLTDAGLEEGQLDVLISCAPCTGFSRTLRKNHQEDDPRNNLVERTGIFVEALRPRVFIMENARELLRGNFSHHSRNLLDHLSGLGYSCRAEIHTLTAFGLPQTRERALIVARRDGEAVLSLPDLWAGHEVAPEALTVRRAIGHLPPVAAGEVHPDDPIHTAPRRAKRLKRRRLSAIPHDGGLWADVLGRPGADELLIPSMKRAVARNDFGSHPDVYGRLPWDRPAVTIKRECAHTGNGRYAHPEQDRHCTIREMALLQGFPSDYRFVSNSLANMYRHVGDAVPPLVSFQLANVCHWMLTGMRPPLADCVLPGTSLRSSDIREIPNRSLFDPDPVCVFAD